MFPQSRQYFVNFPFVFQIFSLIFEYFLPKRPLSTKQVVVGTHPFFARPFCIENKKPMMVVYSSKVDSYYYIKSPGITLDTPNKYKLIIAPKAVKIPTTAVSGDLQKTIRSSDKKVNLSTILKSFTTKKSVKIGKRLKIVEQI